MSSGHERAALLELAVAVRAMEKSLSNLKQQVKKARKCKCHKKSKAR